MKLVVIREACEEATLTLRCADPDAPEVHTLRAFLAGTQTNLAVQGEEGTCFLSPQEILYGEFVGRGVFLYTAQAVYPTALSLAALEAQDTRFFRCAKSMVVSLAHIRHLQSEASGRILARLSNDERIVISRHYAAALRRRLYGDIH